MKRYVIIFLLVIFNFSYSGNFLTAGDLSNACENWKKEPLLGVYPVKVNKYLVIGCLSFLQSSIQAVFFTTGIRNLPINYKKCFLKQFHTFTTKKIYNLVIDYLTDMPKIKNDPAFVIVSNAIFFSPQISYCNKYLKESPSFLFYEQ